MIEIPPCGVAVISNPMVCDVCVFHVMLRCLGKLNHLQSAGVACLTFLKPILGEPREVILGQEI